MSAGGYRVETRIGRGAATQSLRVEVSSDHALLLPHSDLVFADLKAKGKGMVQQFRIVFATHEVLVRGLCSRRIETSMQRLNLSFVTQFPARRME